MTAAPISTATIAHFFQQVAGRIQAWTDPLDTVFAESKHPPSRRAVDAVVQPLAIDLLQDDTLPLAGAGFVAARAVLSDAQWHMAWWQGAGSERVLSVVEDLGRVCARREWYTVPLQTGRAHIAGPYVDYLCTDEYTMTVTTPIMSCGRTIGVAGADVLVESLEPLLETPLVSFHPSAVLVNQHGRIIIAADSQLAAGTLLAPGWPDLAPNAPLPLRGDPFGPRAAQWQAIPGLPLAVVYPSIPQG